MCTLPVIDANQLLDWVRLRLQLKTDRQLCQALGLHAPVISKLRHGRVRLGAAVLVRILDVTNTQLCDLPSLVSQAPRQPRKTARQIPQESMTTWIRHLA